MNIENKEKEYKSTDHLKYSCQYHIIFCPKYRKSILKNGVDESLKEIILLNEEKYKYKVLEMEVLEDHVHLLLDINPKIGIFSTVCSIKGFSARYLRSKYPYLKSKLPCLWTRSCFISTVGSVSLEIVKKYIEEQKDK